jgi:cytochrome c biogenesis protein CcdA
MRSPFLLLVRAFIVLALLSNSTYSFYVISNSDCEPCNEKLDAIKNYFPGSTFTEYELKEDEARDRFNAIDEVIGEAYLPMPLLGVFHGEWLFALVAGGQTREDWESLLMIGQEGVPLYVQNMYGRAEYKKTIVDAGDIARLEELFTAEHVSEGQLTFWGLIAPVSIAAAIDAVNPCAISVLLVMLTFVFYGVERGVVLKTGLSFCSAVFLSYLLIGVGLIRVFSQAIYIKYAAVAFALLLGTLRIVEFFTGEMKHLPGAFSRAISQRLENVSDPRTAFVAGVVTATLLMPCSSAPYFLALNLISERSTALGGLVLLIIYNLIIVVPLAALTFMVHVLGVTTMDLKLWMVENRRLINLLLGVGLVLLAVLVLFGYV